MMEEQLKAVIDELANLAGSREKDLLTQLAIANVNVTSLQARNKELEARLEERVAQMNEE
jgi:hypothetical protein